MFQPSPQVGLTDKDEAEKICMIELKVRQKPYLLKGFFVWNELGLINNDHRSYPGLVIVVYLFIDRIEQVVFIIVRDINIEAFCNGPQELNRGQLGVDDQQ